MAITLSAVVATVNGNYMKAYDVASSDVANDETADLAHDGVVDFAGAAVAPNFYAIVDTHVGAALAAGGWAVAPTAGATTTKVTISRTKGAGTSASARVYIGYLHTVMKGQAT